MKPSTRKAIAWLAGVTIIGAGVAAVAFAPGTASGSQTANGITWDLATCTITRMDANVLSRWMADNVRDIVVDNDIRTGTDLADALLSQLAPESCAFPPPSGTPDGDEYERIRDELAPLFQQVVDNVWAAEQGIAQALRENPYAALVRALRAFMG